MASPPHAPKPLLSLDERKAQVDNDWLLIYNLHDGIIYDIETVLLQTPMSSDKLTRITEELATFCLTVCANARPIRGNMSAQELNSTLFQNVQARLDNGMIKNNQATRVRKFRVSLETLLKDVRHIYGEVLQPEGSSAAYAGAATSASTTPYPAANDYEEMDVDEYDDMPALETEDSLQERERNKNYDLLLAKSRLESEALDIALQRDMVDGFFDYNPHTTTPAMEQARYAREVAVHNSMIQRSEAAVERMHFFANHAYDNWRDMDACLQNVTEMPQIDRHNHGFF